MYIGSLSPFKEMLRHGENSDRKLFGEPIKYD